MRKKRKKEVVHVEEVDRQLPAKHQPFPDLEDLNRLVQNIIAEERRQSRRTFVMITSLLTAFFILLLAGMGWFARDLMQQLKAERRLSEKSREDMLGLIYAGHATTTPQPATTTAPAAALAPPPPEHEPTAVSAHPPTNTAEAQATSPAPPPPVFRKSVKVQVAEDLTMRLPIPNP